MNTPKRPLSAADHFNQLSTPSSSCSPPPTKRAKPNTHHRQNGSANAAGNDTEKPAWQRPIERLLDAFRAFVPTPATASPSSTGTLTLASNEDDDESVFRIKDPRDHTRTRDQLEREIKALRERREHLKREYGHQVIAARRAHSTVPDKPRELAEIPKRINHLRQIATTARRDDGDDMPRRANVAKQDGKGQGQNAPSAYARRQPMGKKEVRVVPNHRSPAAVHGPELTVTQPRSAPPPPPPDSLPVLAHPSPLLLPPRSSHSSAVTDQRPPRRRRTPSPPPPPPPPPMGPSENPRPPWAPTWDPTTTPSVPEKPSRSPAPRPKPTPPPPTRSKQIRAKVKARDESDIEYLASAQPPAEAAASSRPSFFTDFDDDEDGENAPEADEDAPILDAYQQQVNAALSQEEAAWSTLSHPISSYLWEAADH